VVQPRTTDSEACPAQLERSESEDGAAPKPIGRLGGARELRLGMPKISKTTHAK
jgi:hypothetical protein